MLGERVRGLRARAGYSRRELAERLQIGEATIARIEDGKQDPSTEIAAKIARFFNVSTDYLIGLTDNPTGVVGDSLSEQESEIIKALRDGDYKRVINAVAGK